MRGVISRVTTQAKSHAMRTQTIDGVFNSLPEPGQPFRLISESLTSGANVRVFVTSPVVTVERSSADLIRFETLNSVYELQLSDPASSEAV